MKNLIPIKIPALSCVDMGAQHPACTVPWDIGGIRTGNRYECMKVLNFHAPLFIFLCVRRFRKKKINQGAFLHSVYYFDASGIARQFIADSTDTKSLTCNKDGWQMQVGPNLSYSHALTRPLDCFSTRTGDPERIKSV